MRSIKRKTLLYRTGVEYGDYALNHVQGCSHNCQYPCYARCLKHMGQDEWCNPAIVVNAKDLLRKELPRLEGKVQTIHMCFSSDPFMVGYPEITYLSLELLSAINEAGIPVTTLTKGIYPTDVLTKARPENAYGITLVSLDEEFRKKMEPGAAPVADRLEALRRLRDMGRATWVSVEPYPTPNIITQDLHGLLDEISFVDKIIFGRLNYSAAANMCPRAGGFYADAAQRVIRFCRTHHIQCHIKAGTLSARPNDEGGTRAEHE